jgi:hypothetical protein
MLMHEVERTEADVTTRAPSAAGRIPPKFRSSFNETSLKDAEWLRLPLPGDRCPLTGLSRTSLVELGERGKIKLIRVRKPGALRGIVLIHKCSLLSYLESLAAEKSNEPDR